jgi:RHS repeat-associated protein
MPVSRSARNGSTRQYGWFLSEVAAIRGSCIVRYWPGLVLVAGLFAHPASLFADVNPDGSFSYSIPIELPAGRNGIQPQLALVYNSNAGNGIVGVGWSLQGLPAITRINHGRGINYDGQDTYAGAEGRLIMIAGASTALGNPPIYHSENETWSKYEPLGSDGLALNQGNRCGGATGSPTAAEPCSWRVTDRSGVVYIYGSSSDSRVVARDNAGNPLHGGAVRLWALARVTDLNGNYYEVEYYQNAGQIYPKRIRYTYGPGASKYYTITFAYDESGRPDKEISYASSSFVQTNWRLREVLVEAQQPIWWIFSWTVQVRRYELGYELNTNIYLSRLAVTKIFDAADSISEKIELIWQTAAPSFGTGGSSTSSNVGWGGADPNAYRFLDINGDGLTDMIYLGSDNRQYVVLNTGTGFAGTTSISNVGWGPASAYQFADVNGNGLPDMIFLGNNNRQYVVLNHGSGYPSSSSSISAVGWGGSDPNAYRFVDIDGNGKADMIFISETGTQYLVMNSGSGFPSETTSISYVGWGPASAYKFADINGDSRPDMIYFGNDNIQRYVLNNGNGFNSLTDFATTIGWGPAAAYQFVDVNADGLNDMIFLGSDNWQYVVLNEGGRFRSSSTSASNVGWGGSDANAYQFMDVDGDNRPEMLFLGGDGKIYIVKNTGSGYPSGTFSVSEHGSGSAANYIFADINGDGLSDMTFLGGDSHQYSKFYPGLRGNILAEVRRLSGVRIAVTYGASPSVPNTICSTACTGPQGEALGSSAGIPNSSPRYLVTSVTTTSDRDLTGDGIIDSFTTTYQYYNGRIATGTITERASLGFEKIKTTDVNSGNYSITTYRQDKPFHGTPLSTRRYLANGTLVAEETAPPLAQYLCTEAGCSLDAANTAHPTLPRQFRQVGPRISKNFEDGVLKLQKTEQVLAYDDYGNAQWIKVTEESRGYQRITYTFRKYINNVGSTRAIGLPYYEKTCLSETECTEGDANFVSAARFYYDNQPLGLNGQRNLLTRKEVYGPVENGFGWVAETFAYNRAGQIEDHRAANGIRTETAYDAEYSSYPASIFTSDGSHYKTTTHLYGPRFGKVRYSSDSETGINEQTDFDAAGRVREKTTRHLSTVIAKRSFYYSAYNAQPSWQRECVHFGSDFTEQRCTTKYHDAWGRVFREEFPEFVNGQYAQMAIERRYDARGREVKVSRPFSASHTGCAGTSTAGTNPAPCEWNVSTHDDYNRIISTTTFQAKTTTFEYPTDGLPSTAVTGIVTTGPDGKKKGEFKNILGKIATTYDAMHDLGRMTTVRYRYDALGRLVTVHAPTGDTVITYVGATSLQKSIFDPVAGLTEYQYYFTPGHPSYGKLRVEKRAGFVTTFEYDAAFGRLSKSTKASTAAPDLPVETTQYIYDEPDKPNGKGRLTTLRHEKDGFTITERYSYDSLGEITETVRTVSHSSLSLCSDPHAIPCTQVYGRNKDNLGRVKEMLYPDGTKTQIEYADPFTTHVKRIRHDGTVYAEYDNYTYDVAPHVGTVRYHNGLTHEYSYYPDTGLLKSAKASNATASLLHLEYDYDASYNIRNVEDKLVGRLSLYYEYDAHNRIQRASRRDGQVRIYRFDNPDAQDSSGKLLLKHNRRLHYPANKTFPTSDEVFDDTILDWKANQTFTWSASGNLIQKGPFTFTYDANGMMSSAVERPLAASPNSGGEEIAETKFYYDHAGQRFLKTHLRNGVMIKTWYLGDGIEFREKYVGVTNTSPGTFDAYQATKYIYGIDDKKLASITGSVKTTLPAATSSTLFALADSYSSTSLAGLTHKAYYTFYGIYALENFSKAVRIAGLSLAALLLFLYLYLTPRPSPKRRGEFPIWMRLTAATVLISFMSVNCGTGNAPGTTPGDLSGLGTPGDATTGAAPANTFISALYTGLPAGTVYYSHNHLGSGALVTDSAGNEVFRITYTEYGEIDLANSGKYNPATGEIEHHLDAALIAITAVKYTGQEYDPETGFYYYNARYYDPQLGVFTTPDTIVPDGTDSQSFNRHMYVRGNPILYNDPSGHFFWIPLIIAAAVGASVGGVAAGTHGNIKGWLDGSQKFDWDAAWKGAAIGAASAAVGFGVGTGVAAAAGGGVAGSIVGGGAGGFAGGFTGGALGAAAAGYRFDSYEFWNSAMIGGFSGLAGGMVGGAAMASGLPGISGLSVAATLGGGVGGGVQAAMNRQDFGEGFLSGMGYGFAGGLLTGMANSMVVDGRVQPGNKIPNGQPGDVIAYRAGGITDWLWSSFVGGYSHVNALDANGNMIEYGDAAAKSYEGRSYRIIGRAQNGINTKASALINADPASYGTQGPAYSAFANNCATSISRALSIPRNWTPYNVYSHYNYPQFGAWTYNEFR